MSATTQLFWLWSQEQEGGSTCVNFLLVLFNKVLAADLLSSSSLSLDSCIFYIIHRVISGPYFPLFWMNTEIYSANLRIQSEYRKIRTRENFLFGHFSRSNTLNKFPHRLCVFDIDIFLHYTWLRNFYYSTFPAGIYLFIVNNTSTITCKISSELTKIPEWDHWLNYGFFIVKFGQILHCYSWFWTGKCLLVFRGE